MNSLPAGHLGEGPRRAADQATQVRAPQPEQTFFADPANDRLLAMVMTLASELWVLTDRLHALESILQSRGTLRREDLDAYIPDEAADRALAADRQAFVKSLMDNVLGHQASISPSA